MNILRLFRRNDKPATRCQIVMNFSAAIQHQKRARDFLWPAGLLAAPRSIAGCPEAPGHENLCEL
jgi:hypothetical protein